MGRKSRFDRQTKSHNPYEHHPPPEASHTSKQLLNSRSRSPTPERSREDLSPYPRGPRDRSFDRPRSPGSSAYRVREHASSSRIGYDMHSSSSHARDDSLGPRERIDRKRVREEEYRRVERYVSPERIQKAFASSPPTSAHAHHDGNHKKFKQSKGSRFDVKKSKGYEKDKYKSTSHQQHDMYKPVRNGDTSRPSSSLDRRESTSTTRSPSPRPDGISQSSSGRDYYASAPSSTSYSHEWRHKTHAAGPPRSPAYRYPPEETDDYRKHPRAEYEKMPPSHPPSQPSSQRRYDQYPTHPKDYDKRDSEQPIREPPKRRRGGDYDREEWERTHRTHENYESRPETRYDSEYPGKSRSSYDADEKYPSHSNSRYREQQSYHDEMQPRRTPQGPRAQYEDHYRQRYPYEPRRPSYEQQPYPPPDEPPRPRSPHPRQHSYDASQYEESYGERYPPPPPPREQIPLTELPPPALAPPPTAPSGPRYQSGFRPIDNRPQPSIASPTSAQTGPKLESGIKPFTLKGNVLQKLKRTRDQDLDSGERIFKSTRVSPRHVIATTTLQMPPPPPAPGLAEIQQTQTPETPSNRERLVEGRVPMKEKGTSIFERIGQVGEGTYGKVYKARNTLTGELVALKKIRMESEREGFPITAMREIKLLESLRHPNIIHLQEMMCEKANVYMIFEYMDHDLAGILTHPTFAFQPSHIKDLLHQMLEGLHYLHHRGILHRDIKGSNILLDAAGTLKLADFGLARYYHKRRPNLDYSNRVITLWYRPPELLLGATAYGPAVDIWSVGCILLEMVARRPIFPGKDEIDQILKIWRVMGSPTVETWPKVNSLPWWELLKPPGEDASRFVEEFSGLLSEQGLDLAAKLLSLDPEQRPTAAEALRHPYFTKELPKPERPIGLVNMEGEWHEFESKQRKRARRESQHAHQLTNADSRITTTTDNPQ